MGTGPLVDPGFCGKLCIPLHNLTSEDYEIPIDEGLIWIEFTKTTSNVSAVNAIGSAPSNTGFWDIEKFINKAATKFPGGPRVAIQSSIPKMGKEAHKSSQDAVKASQTASKDAKSAKDEAESARLAAEVMRDRLNRIGWVAAAAIAIAILGLWATFFFGVRSDVNALNFRLDTLKETTIELFNKSENENGVSKSVKENLVDVESELARAIMRISELEEYINELSSRSTISEPGLLQETIVPMPSVQPNAE